MTNHIEIDVETTYLSSESNPEENKYYFLYTVLIKNNGDKRTKLLSRHWVIKDDNGKVQDVKGEGVIGEPVSYTHLTLPTIYSV